MSNQYANRVFSEHPIALWAFDEKANYCSLLSETERTVSGWTAYGATATSYSGTVGPVFKDSSVTQIVPKSKNLLTYNQATAESASTTQMSNHTGGTFVASTDTAYQGTYSFKLSVNAGADRLSISTNASRATATAGKTYYATARIKADAGNNAADNTPIYLYIDFLDGGGSVLQSTQGSSITATSGGWTEVKHYATAPANTATARILIYRSAFSVANSVHYIDGLGLYQMSSEPTWDDPNATPDNVANRSLILTSSSIWSGSDIYLTETTVPISASFWIYMTEPSIDTIDFGTVNSSGTEQYTVNVMPSAIQNQWVRVSAANLLYSKLFIRINYKSGQTTSALTWLINGLAMGQFSEATSASSLGIEPTNPAGTEKVITDGALPNSAAVEWYEAKSVGVSQKSLYYVARDKRLLAYNTAMPIAYGSEYLTRLLPIDSPNEAAHPSLVFDGCGMFNEQGRYDTYTLEFWLRVSGFTNSAKRILGPAIDGSEDGLWITESVMTLSLGGNYKSYNLGIMSDPMLIDIVYAKGSMLVMIDGDTVISMDVNPDTVELPSSTNQWWGFYAYDDLDPMEIDCLSIYGYAVPSVVAKRRFIWGQGVGDIGNINEQFGGKTAWADFSTSNASASVSFPDTFFWDAGNAVNLDTSGNTLSVPKKELPEIIFTSKTKADWYADQLAIQGSESFFSFWPDSGWDDEITYARMSPLSKYASNVVAIAIEWERSDDQPHGPLLKLNFPGDETEYIEAYVTDTDVKVDYVNADGTTELYSYTGVTTWTVNNDVEQITIINTKAIYDDDDAELPYGAYRLLSSADQLALTIGSNGEDVFNGKVLRVSLFDDSTYTQTGLGDWFFDGTVLHSISEDSVAANIETGGGSLPINIGTYTWLPVNKFGAFYEDIGIRGSWEEYIPLSLLSKVVKDFDGNDKLAVDHIQFNMGYPRPRTDQEPVNPATWTYSDVFSFFATKTLAYLYYGYFTGMSTYADFKNRVNMYDLADFFTEYDTTDNFIRAYVALQKSNKPLKRKSELEALNPSSPPTAGKSVYMAAYDDYTTRLFEMVDGYTIVPPRNSLPNNFSLSVFIDFVIPGINTYPMRVRSLELMGQAQDRYEIKPLGTKHGKDIYPISWSGSYYDAGATNPFRINKRGRPYLYLGHETGFVPAAIPQTGWSKGMQVVIPETADTDYALDNIQFWLNKDTAFPAAETKFAEFIYGDSKIYFTVQSYQTDKMRGIVRAYDQNNMASTNVTFFQNGNLVAKPILEFKQWNAIAVSFPAPGISLSEASRINVYPGFSYNNISYFAVRPSGSAVQANYRLWSTVDDQVWSYWATATSTYGAKWNDVLISGSSVIKNKELAQQVYKTYAGIASFSIEESNATRFSQDVINTYNGVVWSTNTLLPT